MFSRSLLFFVTACLLYYYSQAAYVPQQPLVEPLTPIGIRISIPHDVGITLVAFHVKFNENFDGLEAGTIARDILRRKNERWTYEDRSTELKHGDVIYYWIHVVYKGLAYNLVNQEHTVTDFYDYKGQKVVSEDPNTDSNNNNNNNNNPSNECISSSTKLYDLQGNNRNPCAGQLLFQEGFRDLTQFQQMQWTIVEQFADAPDYEFVVYRNSPANLVVENGLKITPKLLIDEYDKNNEFISKGKLTLQQCTGRQGTSDCQREANGWRILPPVTSSRINTKSSFNFLHGRVEIRAKFPLGDWIYPLLMLEPTNSQDSTLQIRIASANGNAELKMLSDGNRDISGHVLWGGITGLDPNQIDQRIIDENTATKFSRDLWSDMFHTYELIWSSDRMILKVDGQVYDDKQISLPANEPFYLTLGVAVGGLSEFPDNCKSGSYMKPWRNVEAKAVYRFFNSTYLWHSTWQTDRASLDIDYVKIWAL